MPEERVSSHAKLRHKQLVFFVCVAVVVITVFLFIPRYTYKTARWVPQGGHVPDFDGIKLKYNNYGIKLTNQSSSSWADCQPLRINEYTYPQITIAPYTTVSLPYKDFLSGYDRLKPKFSKKVYGFEIWCDNVNGDSRTSVFRLD